MMRSHWKMTKCAHTWPSKDGMRQIRCGNYSKYGSPNCHAHQDELRPFNAQEAAIVIASFFELFAS